MKNLVYLFLILLFSSCSVYNVTGQSPHQYTSASEQIVVNDYYDEPYDIQNVYINYTPTFSFADYYSWYWWRPNRRFYYWMYPTTSYWGWNYYNSWGWNSWNYYGWNNYPHYLNNWSYFNNIYHPYTYNPYFYHPNNFGAGCHSPFYKQNTHNWKKSLNQPTVNLQKLDHNKTNYTSIKPEPVKTFSGNSPKRPDNLSQRSYDRPKQDLRVYDEQRYNTPSRNTETRTFTKPERVEYKREIYEPTRSTYQRQERTNQIRTNYERPKSTYRPSTDQVPTKYRPSNQPSRSTYQPRTNYGGTRSNFGGSRGNSPSQRSNFGVKGGR